MFGCASSPTYQFRRSHLRVNLRTFLHKLLRLGFHTAFEDFFLGDALFGGVFADVFGDLHRAEVRAVFNCTSRIFPFSPTMSGNPRRAFSARSRRATRRKARCAGARNASRSRFFFLSFISVAEYPAVVVTSK